MLTRIIWLMEELGEPYEIVPHTRKSQHIPLAADARPDPPARQGTGHRGWCARYGQLGAIIEYVIATYGGGKLIPARSGPAWARYIGWLHFAEGSAMMPLLVHLLGMLTGGLPDGLKGFIAPDIEKTLKYIAAEIPDNGYLTDAFSGADIQMSYVLEVARMGKLLAGYPSLEKYMARLEQRPAYKRSIERGGPVRLPLG